MGFNINKVHQRIMNYLFKKLEGELPELELELEPEVKDEESIDYDTVQIAFSKKYRYLKNERPISAWKAGWIFIDKGNLTVAMEKYDDIRNGDLDNADYSTSEFDIDLNDADFYRQLINGLKKELA